jgi:putative ABC transport system permease protein
VAVCGTVVVLYAQASLDSDRGGSGGPVDPQVAQLHTVTTALTLLLAVMAGVNLVFVTRASAVDARRVLALARTLGVTPSQAATALGVSQLVPAITGLLLGWITGALLFHSLASSRSVAPPTTQLLMLAVLILVTTIALTAGPASLEARRPLAETLREL